MILPSKHVSQERALITLGLRILQCLREPKTVSALWEDIPRVPKPGQHMTPSFSYNTFVLALDLLFLTGAIEFSEGLLTRRSL
jgi:hypothetical protein